MPGGTNPSPSTKIVAHSAGAEFVLRWLSENKDAALKRVVPLHHIVITPASTAEAVVIFALDTTCKVRNFQSSFKRF